MHKLFTNDNDFEMIEIKNENATAKIALQGAHLFEYTRRGEAPLLWVSPTAHFEKGKAIRGGIPVCWPWFGKNAEHPGWPQHGFARTAHWKLESITEPTDRLSVVTLSLESKQLEQSWFPFRFRLNLRIGIGETLSLSLTTENYDDTPITITEALHTYFSVGDIATVSVTGLERVTYADNLENFAHKSETSAVTITGEIDRVYLDTEAPVTIRDGKRKRSITVGSRGSRSTVVWNPWITKAAAMADFADDGYKTMLCIETANALTNKVTIAPGESHTMTQTIR